MKAGLLALLALSALACTRSARPLSAPETKRCAPIAPASIADLHTDFFWQQRVTARFTTRGEQRTISFRAIVQKQGRTLTVLGLTPFGSRAFRLVQTTEAVHSEQYVPLQLPLPPTHILADLHRVFFIRLSTTPLPDGRHRGSPYGINVREQWRGGRLRIRRLRQRDCDHAITIDYGAGMSGLRPPPRITLHHQALGYTLHISTIAQKGGHP